MRTTETGSSMVRMAALVFAALVAAAACVAQADAPTASPSPLTSSVASASPSALPSPLLSGGIPEARAIELARGHSSLTTFVSASAGLFRDLNIDPNIGPGYPVKPDQTVWAVKFAGEVTICNPLGACFSPRPGITAVYLDYETGDFLSAGGVTPAP